MGCPKDHRVPNLYPGHPIFTMMPQAYVWVSHMLLLQSAESLSGEGDTTNTMTMAPTIAAICVAFVVLCEAGVPYQQLYISRRWSTLTTPKCLQRQDTFSYIDYVVQWVNMGDITSVEDICNSVTFKSPTSRDVKSATSPHHASIVRSTPPPKYTCTQSWRKRSKQMYYRCET